MEEDEERLDRFKEAVPVLVEIVEVLARLRMDGEFGDETWRSSWLPVDERSGEKLMALPDGDLDRRIIEVCVEPLVRSVRVGGRCDCSSRKSSTLTQ